MLYVRKYISFYCICFLAQLWKYNGEILENKSGDWRHLKETWILPQPLKSQEEIEDEESVKIDETFESENLESEHFSQAENKMYEMFTSAHSNRRFRPVSLESKCESIVSGATTGTCYIEWPFIGKGQYQIDGFPEECKLELMNNTINEEAMPADFRRADKIISTLKGDYEKNAEIFQAKFVEFCDKKGETVRIE